MSKADPDDADISFLELLAKVDNAPPDASAEHVQRGLESLIRTFPERPDLTREQSSAHAVALAAVLERRFPTTAGIDALEQNWLAQRPPHSVLAHLAVKLARSRQLVGAIDQPLHVSVVIAVFREHNRILRRDEHDNGEDFLRRKIGQLHALFHGCDDIDFELILVDDGCPEGTGDIARRIIAEEGYGDVARVLFLQDGIDRGDPVAATLGSTADSIKGGAILYGMWDATRRPRDERHVVLFTDADLSTHLGQSGLLIAPILTGASAAIGSRRERTSVVIKEGTRNDRGKLFIYLWKRLLPTIGGIVDTQCGFKAFDADLVRRIVTDIGEKKFAFDIELMLQTELDRADSIRRCAICWIDSEAESTTTDIQPYLSMLQAVAGMYRRYLPADETADSFAAMIESLDDDAWDRLVARIPDAITSRDPAEFAAFDAVSADDLRAAAYDAGET